MKLLCLSTLLLFLLNVKGQVICGGCSSESQSEVFDICFAEIGDFQECDSMNVLVLLDGDEYMGLASDIVSLYVESGSVHPTLIIGLPSTIESRWKYYTPSSSAPNSNSDSHERFLFSISGSFIEFHDFVKDNLLPSFESEYGDIVIQRTIFGHSMGGLGALNFVLNESQLFDNYIVSSPSLIWDGHYFLEQLESEIVGQNFPISYKSMFLAIAGHDIEYYEEALEYFIVFLNQIDENKNSKVIKVKYDSEIHLTVGLRTLFDGIVSVLRK